MEPSAIARRRPPNVIILDVRPRKQYDEGRIPGAVWVDGPTGPRPSRTGKMPGLERRIGKLGIGSGLRVIVYDNSLFNEAARIWWILRYWGVDDVRLLNGNWMTWKKAGLTVRQASPGAVPARSKARPRPQRLATKDLVLASLKDGSLQIVDARSLGEFCGIDKLENRRGGAIPVKHLEWIDLIDKQTQRFKNPDYFAGSSRTRGSSPRPTATHCQGGGRAAVMAFGMELMGYSDVHQLLRELGRVGQCP